MSVKDDAATSDHDLLIRLDEKMDAILLRLEKGDKCMEGHEKRLVRLEMFQSTILAFAGAISLVISIVGSWVLSHFKVA